MVARAETLDGEKIEIEATGLLARALQHEVDHLHGVLFIDRMSAVTKVALRQPIEADEEGEHARSLGDTISDG